jgi:hypothetical protein
MTFGSFQFLVGKEGSHRLVAPIFLGPLAVKSNFLGSSISSVESGDEEISLPSFTKPADGGALADLFDDMTFGSFMETDMDNDSESFNNSGFTNFYFTNNSTASREVFADLYDGVTDPEDDENRSATYHQICVIAGASRQEDEESKAFNDLGNPYVDPADLTRGTENKYTRITPREKLQLPQEAWYRAARAMDGTEPMTTTATPQALQEYQYKIACSR